MRSDLIETPKEKAQRLGVKLIPRQPGLNPGDNDVVAVCGECGVELRRVMWYVCQRSCCPCNNRIRVEDLI